MTFIIVFRIDEKGIRDIIRIPLLISLILLFTVVLNHRVSYPPKYCF